MPARTKTTLLCKECRKSGNYIKATTNDLCNDHHKYKFEPLSPSPLLARDVATAVYHIQSHNLDKVVKSLERRKNILTEANKLRIKHVMEIKMELLTELSFYNKLKQRNDHIDNLNKEIVELRGEVSQEEVSNFIICPNPQDFDYLSWKPLDDHEKDLFRDAVIDLDKEYVHTLGELNEHIKELVSVEESKE